MTTEMIVAAVLYNLAVLGLAWAWLRASSATKDTENQLRRLMGASIDLNVALDQYVADVEADLKIREEDTKSVVHKVNGLRLQLQAADTFLRE